MKTYLAIFDPFSGDLDSQKFAAPDIRTARLYANKFKRLNFKGRCKTTVKPYKP